MPPSELGSHAPLASAYLRFLRLAHAVQQLQGDLAMDANESALLEVIVLRWSAGQPMTVREAIGTGRLGSPATLHKRITRLRQKDMLTASSACGDRRAKRLVPTARAVEYFAQLGQHMAQAQLPQTAHCV